MDSMIIPLNDGAARERQYRFQAGLEFFQTFDNAEILDADVNVEVLVRKEGTQKVEADLHMQGTLTVACDRCLEPLALPVDTSAVLDAAEEGLFSPEGDLDLRQAVYDYLCLALPIQRVHPEGACNPDTVRFLGHQEPEDEEAEQNSPFAALKGLLKE